MPSFSRASIVLAAAPLLSVPECGGGSKTPRRHFDAPQAVAVAPYGTALPPHPFAFVADNGNRAIRTIDLEDRDRGQRLPTGRSLSALVPHLGPAGVADAIWGVDRDDGSLVRLALADALLPAASAPSFDDAGAPSDVTIEEIDVESGRTASATWMVTYREGIDRWEVRGPSGVQQNLARTGVRYRSDEREVRFTIRRTGDAPPTEGDTFTFATDNGLDVVAVTTTGKGVGLAGVSNDVAVLATGAPGSLVAVDLASGIAAQSFGLAPGAIPGGMELAPDGGALWIADLGNPLVYRLSTTGPPASWSLASFPMPVPMRDVAVSGDGARLFTLAADADDVFAHVLPDVRPLDLVGLTPEIDPLPLRVAVRAIAGARTAVVMRGADVPAFPVLLTTHAGNVFFLNGATGCLDYANVGPRLTGIRFRDAALGSNPKFDLDAFAATSCGGFVNNENWTLTYNGLLDAWEVVGSVSGKQQNLLYEDELYVTDRGELTLRIAGDAELPTDDGDQFVFSITDGLTPLSAGLIPDRPAFAVVGEGVGAKEYAIIAGAASDSVSQVDVERRRVTKTYR